ncbi:hypothetical protein [Desulfocurvibacter africanus]|uniref:Zinc finger CHC2-type domain-containing protein n=1 Tax=Desulfocurvibacter africanus subsp. africanus str. Walvis Bay TaxID=690850 RepID=F3Z2R9_DESAF|nr:hypothetical protein [Desulfocurvibacter africanus]EGJ50236.1 hypothetical protein Desaf_1907 [Desulfocurvibacter africanus subsp. africanus str. Walvis Bay]
MGLAQEWLGPAGCRAVAEQLLRGVGDPRSRTLDKQSRIGAFCPFHAERTEGGAFFYDFEEDHCMCHSCGEHGDLLHIYNRIHGRDGDDKDGVREFKECYAPDAESPRREHRREAKASAPARRDYRPTEKGDVPDVWAERANSFIEHSRERLRESPEIFAEQLGRYGITEEVADLSRLGWNERFKQVPVTRWGLPYEDDQYRPGKERMIRLYHGLVIPYYLRSRAVKVKFRRADPGEGARYMPAYGGMSIMSVYGNPAWKLWLVVETERDGVLGWQAGRKFQIGFVSTCSASWRPDPRTHGILGEAEFIGNALDTDQAGAKNRFFWQETYPQQVRTPVPAKYGKDLGDLGKAGGEHLVREFILSALPSHVRRQALRNAGTSAPVQVPASAPIEGNQPGQAEQAKPVELPESVHGLLAVLRKCRRAAAVATDERIGVDGCDSCSKRAVCEINSAVSQALMTDDAVLDYVAAQPEGRLRG